MSSSSSSSSTSSSSTSERAPIWILKWKLKVRERGRKHMAIFIPNPQYRQVNLTSSTNCIGTLLHVVGSPLSGFVLNVRLNWNRAMTDNVESSHFIASVDGKYAPEPATTNFVAQDSNPTLPLGRLATSVRPPGPSSNTADAVSFHAIISNDRRSSN